MNDLSKICRPFAALLLVAAAACGPEPDRPRVIPDDGTNGSSTGTNNGTTSTPTNNGTTSTNNGTTAANDACADVECEPDRMCVKGVCVLADLGVACRDAEDLGELDVSGPVTIAGDTTGFSDSLTTTCAADDGFSGADRAYRFTVPSAVRVDAVLQTSSGIDWVAEVRTGGCESTASVLTCSDNEQFPFVAQPGIDYWLVVEPYAGIDEGAFELDLSFTAQQCTPPGGRTCDGDDVLVCQGGTSQARHACATGCAGGGCGGDSCATAYAVDGPVTLSGDTSAYSETLDFGGQASCSMDGDQGISTPGSEVVLLLRGLTAGETVTVDASTNDDNDNAIFVQETCGDSNVCLAAQDLEDRLEFQVPADGDYYVVIDKLTSSPKAFTYSVDIQ